MNSRAQKNRSFRLRKRKDGGSCNAGHTPRASEGVHGSGEVK